MNPDQQSSRSSAILVVEDEFLIAIELVEILEEAGYEVIGPANTVERALNLLDRHAVRACVLDVNLRGVHSTAVAGALKTQNVPFVLSSAYGRTTLDCYPEFHDATNLGKPISASKLLSTLDSFSKA